ncbi:hypothetical protein [Streptomyces sp. NPDC101393]
MYQECHGPLESSSFEYDPREEDAPPADGVHCAAAVSSWVSPPAVSAA